MTGPVYMLFLLLLIPACYCAFWFLYGFVGHLVKEYRAARDRKRREKALQEWRENFRAWLATLLTLDSDPALFTMAEPSDDEIHKWIDKK